MIIVNILVYLYNYSWVICKREYVLFIYGFCSLMFVGDKMRFVGGCERENLLISMVIKFDN